MVSPFYSLPTALFLGLLVVVFSALSPKDKSARTRFWLVAWLLVFTRAIVQYLALRGVISVDLANAINVSLVQCAAVLFLVSVSEVADTPRKKTFLLTVLIVPVTVACFLLYLHKGNTAAYLACMAVMVFLGMGMQFRARKNRFLAALIVLNLGVVSWCVLQVLRGHPEYAFFIFMGVMFLTSGLLFWRRYRRATTGIVTTCCGFVAWSLVTMAVTYSRSLPFSADVQNELMNLPKFIVAIGMIVTLLEEQGLALEDAHVQERTMRKQTQRYSDLISRLLSGADVRELAGEIVETITQVSSFERAYLLLVDDERHISVAGSSGVSREGRARLDSVVAQNTLEQLLAKCTAERRLSANCYRLLTEDFPVLEHVMEKSALIVPLRSPQGVYVGVLGLHRPMNEFATSAENLSRIEYLAADIAVAIGNFTLQKHLIRSEKLAGIGRLVSGVAHELNNPLTSVLGYSEMLLEQVTEPNVQRDLGVLRREALRMKKIIEGLLRFSQGVTGERRSTDVAALIDDVLKLRGYEMQKRGISVRSEIAPTLPTISADENLIKQVLFNAINNSMDALENSPTKQVIVEAHATNGRVQIRITDSGPGFTDVTRVFDPFFTTKGLGKGTGLGLSLSYGIIRDHGGEITAFNVQPHGACLSIEIPATAAAAVASSFAR